MPNSTFRTNSARHKPYQETAFPIGSIIISVVLLVLACLVIFGDRHLRNGTMVLDDGTLIKNGQVDTQPLQSDVRIPNVNDASLFVTW